MQIPEYMSLSLQGYQFIRFGYLIRVNLTHSFFTFKSLICQLSELKCNAQLKKNINKIHQRLSEILTDYSRKFCKFLTNSLK